MSKMFTLTGPDGLPYESVTPGTFGGYRRKRIYGRLDCSSANRWIGLGGYTPYRVFFATEAHAVAAGYRPCAICMPEAHLRWKQQQAHSSAVSAPE